MSNLNRSEDLEDLLEELEPLGDEVVGTIESSKMIITTPRGEITFDKTECEKLLQDSTTVKQLFDALGGVKCSIELYGLELTETVEEAVRDLFNPVDEY